MDNYIVRMDDAGRLTVPEEVRRVLGLNGETDLLIRVDAPKRTLVLRPVAASGGEEDTEDDDSWAYTPEHLAQLARAHRDSRQGRVRRMTKEELMQLGGLTDGDA